MKSTACTIFLASFVSRTVVVVIMGTHLYVTKQDEREKSDYITKIANTHCARVHAAI
jgi:hypothetical protein